MIHRSVLALALMLPFLHACKKKDDPAPDPAPSNPPAVVVNAVKLRFVNTELPSEIFEIDYSFPGGAGPVVSGDNLLPDRAYALTLRFRDDAASPSVDHTPVIASQGSRYQVFFAPSGIALNVLYADQDGNGRPIGLSTTAIAGSPGLGMLHVRLLRDLDKGEPGVAQGDPTNAGGDLLFEAWVPVRIDD